MFSKLKNVFSKISNKTTAEDSDKLSKKIEVKDNSPIETTKIKTAGKKLFGFKKKVEGKKGFFKRLSEKKINELTEELEEGLLQNNVAYDIAEKICSEIKKSEKKDVKSELKKILTGILNKPEKIDILEKIKDKKPYIILFIGVNGAGKTTTVAKLADWIQKNKKTAVLAASDTFRAAAIEQLQKHADNVGVKLVKHKYGSDAAAVAFDAINHAKAKRLDFVLIDSAGRNHANQDLMDELAKIKRVAKPDLTLLVVDSLTGNDAVEQAKKFNELVGIDGSILTKVDADERGGAIISVGYETEKPILFLGVGQNYEDLKEFNSADIIKQIL